MSLMLLFSGVIFLALSVYVIHRDSQYIRKSTVVPGRIVKIHEKKVTNSNGAGHISYIPTVEYHAFGKKWRFEGDNQGAGHNLKPGQSISIRIQNGNYKVARLEQDIQTLNSMMYLFMPLGLLAIIAGVSMFNLSDISVSVHWIPVILGLAYVGMKVWPSLPFLSSLSSIPIFSESKEVTDQALD